jgi:PAS domain S-box-containing protein
MFMKPEEKWHSLIENVPDIIMVVDRDGTIQFINHTVSGTTTEQAVGKRLYDHILAEHHEIMRKSIEQVFQTGQGNDYELLGPGPNGTTSWYWSRIGPIKHNGQVVAASIITRDITERKRAEDETKLLKRQLEFILGATKTGLDIIDSQFNIRFIDSEWQKIYGDPTGKKCYEYFMGRNKVCPECGIVKALQTKSVIVSEEVLVKENNRPIQVITIPFQDEKGEWLVAEVNVDITERKRVEDSLRESEERMRGILDATTESVLVVNKQNTITAINKTGAQRLGKSVEEILGLNVIDLISDSTLPDVVKSRREMINKVIQTGKPVHFEDHRGKIIFDSYICPVFDEKGQVTHAAIFARDITERINAEKALLELKNRYQTLFECAPIGIGIATREGRVLEYNDALLKITGYSDAEFKQINIKDTYQEPRMRELLLKKLQTDGRVSDFEVQLRRKDGTVYYASLTVIPLVLHDQDVLLTVQKDITERKKMEELIKESEEKFRIIFDNAADGILLADAKTRKFHTCNSTISQMLGYSPEEIKNLGVADIHPKENLLYVTDQFERLLRGELTLAKDIPVKRKDGSIFYADISSTPVKLAGKRYLLGIFRNITEHKQAKEELDIYREHMAQMEQLASLGTLSATIAHELTQPLTVANLSLGNALAELEKTSCPDTVIEGLKDGLAELSQMTSIIDRFRNFARRSSDEIICEVEIKAVAERIFKLLSENARRAKVTLYLKDIDKLPPLHANPKDMEQLFFALVDNAIHAADGKKSHQLIISGNVKDKHIELQFADNCRGIAPENLDRLFEPFFTTSSTGTGLGLCIVRDIVSRAGGNISVKSKLGKGSTFFVTLPTCCAESSTASQ